MRQCISAFLEVQRKKKNAIIFKQVTRQFYIDRYSYNILEILCVLNRFKLKYTFLLKRKKYNRALTTCLISYRPANRSHSICAPFASSLIFWFNRIWECERARVRAHAPLFTLLLFLYLGTSVCDTALALISISIYIFIFKQQHLCNIRIAHS